MSDCCEGLKQSLANLEKALAENKNAMNGINGRLGKLENDINKLKQGDSDNKSLSALAIRVGKLETYCDSLEAVFLSISKVLKPISKIFGR